MFLEQGVRRVQFIGVVSQPDGFDGGDVRNLQLRTRSWARDACRFSV